MTVYAHAGHVLVDMLYAVPLVIMVGLLVIGRMREKRARGTDREPGGLSGRRGEPEVCAGRAGGNCALR